MAYKLAGPSQIRDMYDKGRKHVEPEVQRYWINLSYLYGEQKSNYQHVLELLLLVLLLYYDQNGILLFGKGYCVYVYFL